MADMTAYVLNRKSAERHKAFGIVYRRGIMYAVNHGVEIPNRKLPDSIRLKLQNQLRDLGRYEARTHHMTAYETKAKLALGDFEINLF